LHVKTTELERPEVDGPEVIVDFLEAYVLTAKSVADVDPVAVPAQAAVSADPSALEVGGVL
jgi:hypothetical protein